MSQLNLIQGGDFIKYWPFLLGCVLFLPSILKAKPVIEGRLINVSTSGKTVLFNLGLSEDIQENTEAVVLKKINSIDANEGMKLIPVARGRIVKTYPLRSVWVLYKIFDPTLLVPSEEFVLLTENQLLKGRENWDAKKEKIISEKNESVQNIKSHLREDKDRLSKKSLKYKKASEQHQTGPVIDETFSQVDADEWKNISAVGEDNVPLKKSTSFYRSELKEDFIHKKRIETFDKLVVNYLQKVNRPGFNYHRFYYNQMKDPVFQEFKEGINHQSEYFAFLELESQKQSKEAVFYRQLLEKGESWSDDFSDEELSLLLDKVGVVYEHERKRVVMSSRFAYQWHFLGGFNFLDNQNRVDEQNSEKTRFNTDIGFRYLPFYESELLQQLSFQFGFKYGREGVSLGNENAQMREYSGSFLVVWNLFHSPYVIDKNSFYFGVGVRSGWAQLTVPEPQRAQANYYLSSLPVLEIGSNYNFSSGYGLRFGVGMERLLLSKSKDNTAGATLPQRQSIQELKVQVGLTKFFR